VVCQRGPSATVCGLCAPAVLTSQARFSSREPRARLLSLPCLPSDRRRAGPTEAQTPQRTRPPEFACAELALETRRPLDLRAARESCA